MSKTVLITGANSGLGFDAARQLATRGWDRVILSARTRAKADDAIARLAELTGRDASTFSAVLFDGNQPASVHAAVASLAETGERLDAVILNAGGVATDGPDGPPRTEHGLSVMFAMNVHGNALLVDGLLSHGLLAEGATVMLAGTEASRGVPAMGMAMPTLPDGVDVDEALEAIATGAHFGAGYNAMTDYGMVKLIGTLWMRHLTQRHGLRALAVSPGFTGGTAAMDKMPAFQRFIFKWVALPLMKLFGNAHGLETGSARYVQALEDDSLEAGGFYASPGKGTGGKLVAQDPTMQPLLEDPAFFAAVGRLMDRRLAAAGPLRAVG